MSKKKLAFLFVCAATVMACNESVEWNADNACQDGKKTCSGDAVMVCKDGTYTEEQKCSGSTPVCKVDGDSASCVAGETPKPTCTPGCNGNTLVTCDAAGNKTETPCTGDTPVCGKNVIGVDACIAASTVTCTPGCSGNILVTCDADGNKTETPCTGDTPACGKDGDGNDACIAASTETCTPGCDGDTLVVCTEDGAVDEDKTVDCTETDQICGQDGDGNDACVDDLSNVKCTYGEGEDAIELDEGDTVCDENGKILTCQEDGTMSEATDCPEATPVCRPDGEGSPVGSCAEYKSCTIGEGEGAVTINHGEKGCDADKAKVLICNDGVLGDDDICDTAAGEACVLGASGYACDTYDPAKDCKDASDNVIKEGSRLCSADGLKIEACNAAALAPVTEGQCDAAQVCRVVSDVPTCVKSYTTIKAIKDDFDAIKTAGSAGLVCSIDVAGVVTATRKNTSGVVQNLFFQDGSSVASDQAAGLYLYNSAGGLDSAVADNIKVVAAKVMVYNGQLEIVDATVTKTTATDTVTPAEITDISTILETTEDAKNARNLMLVTVKNVTTDGSLITDSGNHSINVSTYIAKDLVKKDDVFKYDITGIVNFNKSATGTMEKANGLAPRTADDLVKVGCIDEDLTFTPASGSTPESCELQEGGACSTPNAVRCDPATNQFHKCTSIGYWGPATACSAFDGLNSANVKTFACNATNDGCMITACDGEYTVSADKLSCEGGNSCGKDMNGNDVAEDSYFCKDVATVAMCYGGEVTDMPASYSGCDVTGAKCNPATVNDEGKCDPPACTKDVCADGKIKKCNSGTLADEVACSGITDATTYGCNTAGDACVATACSGDKVPSADGLSCVENTTSACSYGGVEVAHGDLGCKSDTTLSMCDNGAWDSEADETCILGCNVSGKECTKCTASAIICEGALAILCDADTKPAASDTQTCKDASHCIAGEGCVECINNDDCAAVEGKSACDTATYKCVPKTCTDAVSSEPVDGDGSIGCMSETKYSVCKNGVWSTVESDIIDCAEESKVCDPASADCKAGSVPEWSPIIVAPEKYIGGTVVKTPDTTACTDSSKPNKITCNNESSNVGTTEPSKACASNADTSPTCELTASTNPSVVGYTTKNINKDGYLTIGKTWPASVSFDSYVKLSLSAADIAKLTGKTKIKASFDVQAKDASKSAKKLQIAFFNGDTMIGTAKEVATSTTKATVSSDEVEFTSTTDLNVRITGYDSTGGQAVYIYPITIEAQ